MVAEAVKTKNDRIDWKTVRGLMVDAIYGGRVDNPHDMRVLITYLRQFFNSDVVRGSEHGARFCRNSGGIRQSGDVFLIQVPLLYTSFLVLLNALSRGMRVCQIPMYCALRTIRVRLACVRNGTSVWMTCPTLCTFRDTLQHWTLLQVTPQAGERGD